MKSQIKRALLEHAGEKLHPREIEERYQASDRRPGTSRHPGRRSRPRAARAIYRSVDIRDTAEVAALLAEIRREHGPVRGIVHGAGVLADRLIARQDPGTICPRLRHQGGRASRAPARHAPGTTSGSSPCSPPPPAASAVPARSTTPWPTRSSTSWPRRRRAGAPAVGR